MGRLSIAGIAMALGAMPVLAAGPQAGQVLPPIKPLDNGKFNVVFDPAQSGQAEIRRTPARATTPIPGAMAQHAALSSFRLFYWAGDHKINSFGVRVLGTDAEFGLVDKDGRDMFGGRAVWLQSHHFTAVQTVTGVGGGEFTLDLPSPPRPDMVPMLAGFRFDRRRGTDANVRLVTVQLLERENKVRVALIDDQGFDARSLPPMIGLAFGLAGIPLGALASPEVAGGAIYNGFNEFGGGRLRQFSASVQFVWVPRAMVLANATAGGQGRRASDGQMPGAGDKIALRGFRLMFTHKDHFVRQVGVHLLDGPDGEPVSWQDRNRDDPIRWSVDYSRIK